MFLCSVLRELNMGLIGHGVWFMHPGKNSNGYEWKKQKNCAL